MSKTLKMSILLIIITLGCLFLTQTKVNAASIESAESLKQVFEGKNATINGKTVTLTGNIEDSDVYEIGGDDYTLDLNGYKFTAGEVYINDGSLTINDSKGNGEIDTEYDFIMVAEGAKLVLNNAKIDYLANEGISIINNGVIDIITNYGTLNIEKGNFGPIWQRGTATIKDGTFTSNGMSSAIDLDGCSTVITGNVEFKRKDEHSALMINSANHIEGNVINQIVGEGYIATYNGYGTNSDSWFDEELQETVYRYEVTYDSIRIIKDETGTIFNKIAPNGVWTINGSKPKDMEEAEFLLTSIVGDIELPEDYTAVAFVEPADEFNPEVVSIFIEYKGSLLKSKTVKAVYNEPSKEVKTKVNSVLNKIAEKTGNNHDVETGFRLEDLYLINYLNASSTGKNSSLALNFAKDLIALTNGGNISYKYDSRLGNFTPTGLWGYSGGRVIVYYNGAAVGTTNIGLTTNHVLYIPSDTANTDEARIAAALKRIENYLGTTQGITITVGGTLESLNEDGYTWKDYGFVDEKTSGANYYNVTIKGETYKFAICKKDENELETPEFLASDILSNISIKSNSSELPLDTAITVKIVTSDEIKNLLGTSAYVAYDISLYSNAKKVSITKLENGKFIVSIPVPEILKDKKVTVYYINNNGEKEERIATVKDGIASFETDHFSTYALAEVNNSGNNVAVNDNKNETGNKNPQTGDNVVFFLVMLVVSVIGITFTTKLKKDLKSSN